MMTPSDHLDPAASIVLAGPMGAGKSSIGKRVARELGLAFIDTDSEIVRVHGAIAQIFTSLGEARFRDIEADTVANSLRSGTVVALGGGAVLNQRTRDALATHRVALLTVDSTVVRGRIRGAKRPLLASGDDPVAEWERIYRERRPIYESVAHVTFDTSSGPLQQVVDAIVDWARTGTTHAATEQRER